MVQTFCNSGNSEGIKGGFHGAACFLAMTMALYNLTAWCLRHERHLGTNAVVYSLAVVWECKQTMRHLRRCELSKSLAPQGLLRVVRAQS